jgi:hypothetical protein
MRRISFALAFAMTVGTAGGGYALDADSASLVAEQGPQTGLVPGQPSLGFGQQGVGFDARQIIVSTAIEALVTEYTPQSGQADTAEAPTPH